MIVTIVDLPQSQREQKKNKIYHTTCVLMFLGFFILDRLPGERGFFRNCLFLTFINFQMCWAYFLAALLIDFEIFPKLLKKNGLDKMFNFCFALSFTAGVMYWLMYFQDKNSILDGKDDMPIVQNIFMHGGNFLLCVSEQVFINTRKTKNHISLYFIFSFFITYISLLKGVFYFTGLAIYPFVNERFVIFTITCIFAAIICLIGHYVYKFLSSKNVV